MAEFTAPTKVEILDKLTSQRHAGQMVDSDPKKWSVSINFDANTTASDVVHPLELYIDDTVVPGAVASVTVSAAAAPPTPAEKWKMTAAPETLPATGGSSTINVKFE